MTIQPAFIVASQNENGSRNFVSAFIGDSKEQLDKAIERAREHGSASVWAGRTGQNRYDDMGRLVEHTFDATEMALFTTDLVWFKGSLCGAFEFDPLYAAS